MVFLSNFGACARARSPPRGAASPSSTVSLRRPFTRSLMATPARTSIGRFARSHKAGSGVAPQGATHAWGWPHSHRHVARPCCGPLRVKLATAPWCIRARAMCQADTCFWCRQSIAASALERAVEGDTPLDDMAPRGGAAIWRGENRRMNRVAVPGCGASRQAGIDASSLRLRADGARGASPCATRKPARAWGGVIEGLCASRRRMQGSSVPAHLLRCSS
jgi:hypothetical protein